MVSPLVSPRPTNPMPRDLRWKGLNISFERRTQSGAQWAKEFGIKTSTFYARMYSGWSMARIRDTPVGHFCRGLEPIVTTAECVPRLVDCRHPVSTAIYKEMNVQQCTYNMLAKRSGVSVSAILGLRRNGPGYFSNVEACANALGLVIKCFKPRNKEARSARTEE